MATNWLNTSSQQYPGQYDDPRVDLGSSGPSTLSNLYDSPEVSYVDQAAQGLSTGLRPGQFAFSGLVPDFTNQQTSMAQDADRAMLGTAARVGAAIPDPMVDNRYADRAMLNTAMRTGSQQRPSAANYAAQVGNLNDIFAGIQADSSTLFDTLIAEAGARGEATAEAIGAQTDINDERIGQAAEVIGGDPAGGLGGAALSTGATAGSQGIRDVQAALGGFLQQSQMRRTNATQDYLAGLQGQSQISMDRARTVGEFALRQQQAIAEQERVRAQNDIAAETASSQYVEAVTGLPYEVWSQLDSATRTSLITGQGGMQQEQGQTYQPGLTGQEFQEAGLSEEIIPYMERVEFDYPEWEAQQDPEYLQNTNPERVIRDYLDEAGIMVVNDDDPRAGNVVRIDGGRTQKIAMSRSDMMKYLDWTRQG